MESITAYFYGEPGGHLDKACMALFEGYDGKHVGSGTWMVGPNKGERDVQYDVPADRADACRTALKSAGFRLQPTSAR